MSADAADAADADAGADADAAAERRLNHSIPRTYFVRGIQLWKYRDSLEVNMLMDYANNMTAFYTVIRGAIKLKFKYS